MACGAENDIDSALKGYEYPPEHLKRHGCVEGPYMAGQTTLKFDYGKNGIEIKLDPAWHCTILNPKKQKVIQDPERALIKAIRKPVGSTLLKTIIQRKERIKNLCIVVSDATRPVPSSVILKALVKELYAYGIVDAQILIVIATGLHRPTRDEELTNILSPELKTRVRVVDHLAQDKQTLQYLGATSAETPIFINKQYYESDVKIATGYVEPHFFFGFSGGRKSIAPGIAGAETIQVNHSAEYIASPYSRFGIYEHNPLHINALEIAKRAGVDFMVNVCINENHEITKVTAGDLVKAHEKLVRYQMTKVFKRIPEPYDIVVCGNGGYPLDLNLYQAVKSMAIGEMGVKKGGTIISVNECAEGVGVGQEDFKKLIFSHATPQAIHEKILRKEIVMLDQWEIQVLTRALMKAEVYVVSKLKEEELGNIGLRHAGSVEEAIVKSLKRHGKNARILFLPRGPQVLPRL